MNSLIGIVVPVYNAEKTLDKCIQSIIGQTYRNWTLVLVDDGSSDKSGIICDKYTKDNRIIVIHKQNAGSINARKSGVFSEQIQSTDYIMFVDSDDCLHPKAVERMADVIVIYNADIVCSDSMRMVGKICLRNKFTPPCFRIKHDQVFEREDIINKLMISYYGISNLPVWLNSKLFKKNIITSALSTDPIVGFMGEDLSISLRAMMETNRIVIIPDRLYYYRVGGYSSNYQLSYFADFMKLYEFKKDYAKQISIPQNWKYFMNVELVNIVKGHFIECIRKLKLRDEDVHKEVEKVCNIQIVREASEYLLEQSNYEHHEYVKAILAGKQDFLISDAYAYIKRNRSREMIKKIFYKIFA